MTSWAGANGFSSMMLLGTPLGGPVCGVRSAHVNDGKFRIDFSGLLGDFPSIHLASQADVRHQRTVVGGPALQQGHRLFTGCRNSRFKTAVTKGVFNEALYLVIVFDHKDDRQVYVQRHSPCAALQCEAAKRHRPLLFIASFARPRLVE